MQESPTKFEFGFFVGVAMTALIFLAVMLFADPWKPHDTASQKELVLQDKLTVVVGHDPTTDSIRYSFGDGSDENPTRRTVGFKDKESLADCKKKIIAAIQDK